MGGHLNNMMSGQNSASSYSYDGDILSSHLLSITPVTNVILDPSLKAQCEGWIGIVNRGEDTELIIASRVEENCLLSIDINVARLVAKESRRNNN